MATKDLGRPRRSERRTPNEKELAMATQPIVNGPSLSTLTETDAKSPSIEDSARQSKDGTGHGCSICQHLEGAEGEHLEGAPDPS
jgi:hypothetical protein